MIGLDDVAEPLSSIKQALLETRKLRAQVAALEAEKATLKDPIAIIGMALRLPAGISTLYDFWHMLEAGKSCVSEVPHERWDMDEFYAADPMAMGKICSRYGAFLNDVDKFDAEFFGISPREAEKTDPQQRLLLEVAWEALEDAGIAPPNIAGSQVGVYVGLSNSDYGRMLLNDAAEIDPHSAAGGALSIAAGRLSYFFNLRGPSMAIDTACSSSLVAMHLACASLRAGETNLAIVGGANLMLLPEGSVGFSRSRMLAADGRCKTFDRDADGYVRGEGCVAIVLMRISDAQRAGHRIHALCRGSAVNQDGRSAGLTAPNGPSQESVLRTALAAAAVAPAAVNYVECHGTGTALGDPIEMQALAAVFSKEREPGEPLRVGAVKANIGHLEAAAGLAGLAKTVLALKHSMLPGQINLDRLTPYVAWDEMPLSVVRSNTEWKRGVEPRIAGVSSFGFSGTNAHVLIEEAPNEIVVDDDMDSPMHVFCVSARTSEALRELTQRYESWLDTTEQRLCDICFTANLGRAHHRKRACFIATSVLELKSQLKSSLGGTVPPLEAGAKADARRSESDKNGGWDRSMVTLQEAYLKGDKIDWREVYRDRKYRQVSLPHYPFQRKSHWLKPLSEATVAASIAKPVDAVELEAAIGFTEEKATFSKTLIALPEQARHDWMFDYVARCIRTSLRLEADHVLAPLDRLTELGMDSLIALELRATISREFGLGDRISSTIAFDAGTVDELVRMISEATFLTASQSTFEPGRGGSIDAHRFTAEELIDLSDEDVEQLIAASIGQMSRRSGAA